MENQTKPQPTHRTRSGLLAGIYSTDNGGEYPVHGWYEDEDEIRKAISWTRDYKYDANATSSNLDIFPLPKKIKFKGWLNVYHLDNFKLHATRNDADYNAGKDRIACVPIELEVEEGQGIENYKFNK